MIIEGEFVVVKERRKREPIFGSWKAIFSFLFFLALLALPQFARFMPYIMHWKPLPH